MLIRYIEIIIVTKLLGTFTTTGKFFQNFIQIGVDKLYKSKLLSFGSLLSNRLSLQVFSLVDLGKIISFYFDKGKGITQDLASIHF